MNAKRFTGGSSTSENMGMSTKRFGYVFLRCDKASMLMILKENKTKNSCHRANCVGSTSYKDSSKDLERCI